MIALVAAFLFTILSLEKCTAHLVNSSTNITETDVMGAVNSFCTGKAKRNFCSNEHLNILFYFALKKNDNDNFITVSTKSELELEKERVKQLEIERIENEFVNRRKYYLKKKKELARKLKEHHEIEQENKMISNILKELNKKNALFFRF